LKISEKPESSAGAKLPALDLVLMGVSLVAVHWLLFVFLGNAWHFMTSCKKLEELPQEPRT